MPNLDVPIHNPQMARIYVGRRSQTYARREKLYIGVAEQLIGTVGASGYLCWETPPARLLLRALYQRPNVTRTEREGLLDLQVEAGKVYHVGIEIPGSQERPRLIRLTAEEWAGAVGNRKPAKYVGPMLRETRTLDDPQRVQ